MGTPKSAKNRRASRAENVVKLNQLSNPVGIPTFAIVLLLLFSKQYIRNQIPRRSEILCISEQSIYSRKVCWDQFRFLAAGSFAIVFEILLISSKMGTLKPAKTGAFRAPKCSQT